jgi:uncharacterized membrane protein
MNGGWLSFAGELGKGGWGRSRFHDALPVECSQHDDLYRINPWLQLALCTTVSPDGAGPGLVECASFAGIQRMSHSDR